MTGLVDDPQPDALSPIAGAPFRLAAAEPGGLFVSLTTERSRVVAVYCPPGCGPLSNLRLVTWDALRPNAPWRNRSNGNLPRGVRSVHAIRDGAWYAAHRANAGSIGPAGWTYLARLDPDTASVTATRWSLLTINIGIVSIFGDERSTELGVEAVGESLASRFVVSPEGGLQAGGSGCANEVFGDTITNTCAGAVTLRGAHVATLPLPSPRSSVQEVGAEGVFIVDRVRNAFSKVSFAGEITDLGLIPDGIGVTRYLVGAARGVAACGGVCIHDRATGTWSRLLSTSYATAHNVFEENANVVQTASAFIGTNGVEVWVIPRDL